MASEIPPYLAKEQQAVEAIIRAAFGGVTREGGVSWSESEVIDEYGGAADRAAARERDRESCWEDLVDDPEWEHEAGIGGFYFLDPVGYRYYIAPAMIRCARIGYGEFIGYALTIDNEFMQSLVTLINPDQRSAIARFVRFMITTHDAADDEIYGRSWKEAYQLFWKEWDTGSRDG